jgi:hypothetical protein
MLSPYVVGPPVEPEHFHGRKSQRTRFYDMLLASQLQPLKVLGLRRSGKTSLLHYLARSVETSKQLQKGRHPTVIAYVDLLNSVAGPADFYLLVAEALAEGFPSECRPDVPESLPSHRAFCKWLEGLRSDYRLVVLLDEFGVLTQSSQFDKLFFEGFRGLISGRFTWVTASVLDLRVLLWQAGFREQDCSTLWGIFHPTPIVLGALSSEESEDLIRRPAESQDGRFHPKEVAAIREIAGDLPYFLQATAEQWYYANMAGLSVDECRSQVMDTLLTPLNGIRDQFASSWHYLGEAERWCLLEVASGESSLRSSTAMKRLLNFGLLAKSNDRLQIAGELLRSWIGEQVSPIPEKSDASRPTVFISYSHVDETEKNRLLVHLGVLEKAGLIDLWSDDRIEAGTSWEPKIQQAIAQAKVAVLLITANFLTSKFILGKEVPALLQRREGTGLVVFPVVAKACAWKNVQWLRDMNLRPKNGRPIWGDGGSHVDEDLAAIAEEVADIIGKIGSI